MLNNLLSLNIKDVDKIEKARNKAKKMKKQQRAIQNDERQKKMKAKLDEKVVMNQKVLRIDFLFKK